MTTIFIKIRYKNDMRSWEGIESIPCKIESTKPDEIIRIGKQKCKDLVKLLGDKQIKETRFSIDTSLQGFYTSH